MLRLVYVSSATTPFSPADLLALLAKSRANNARDGISGLLLYKGGNFMQALEGPAAAVRATHRRIAADPRHRGMTVLLTEDAATRDFDGWAMGFGGVNELTADERRAVSPVLEDGEFTDEDFGPDPGRAWRLLLSFRRNVR